MLRVVPTRSAIAVRLTANMYTHVLVDESELDYGKLLHSAS
jgi:hypothetical protein